MAMSPRLLRPIASGVHPEAAAWRSAVVANGGSVSASTVKAVSTFCAAIDSAGIRDRFYRLNLFAGTGLNAALVPLYRGPSRTGTQYGNSVDQSLGSPSFGPGDYTEAGASGGLLGNGSSKYLDTGLGGDFPKASGGDVHFGAYATVLPTTNTFQRWIGMSDTASPATYYSLLARPDQSPPLFAWYCGGNATTRQGAMSAAGHYVGTDAVNKRIFFNGSEDTSSAQGAGSNTTNGSSRPFFVFAENTSGSPSARSNGRMAAYHIGVSLTNGQVASLYSALQAFQTALGRNV